MGTVKIVLDGRTPTVVEVKSWLSAKGYPLAVLGVAKKKYIERDDLSYFDVLEGTRKNGRSYLRRLRNKRRILGTFSQKGDKFEFSCKGVEEHVHQARQLADEIAKQFNIDIQFLILSSDPEFEGWAIGDTD